MVAILLVAFIASVLFVIVAAAVAILRPRSKNVGLPQTMHDKGQQKKALSPIRVPWSHGAVETNSTRTKPPEITITTSQARSYSVYRPEPIEDRETYAKLLKKLANISESSSCEEQSRTHKRSESPATADEPASQECESNANVQSKSPSISRIQQKQRSQEVTEEFMQTKVVPLEASPVIHDNSPVEFHTKPAKSPGRKSKSGSHDHHLDKQQGKQKRGTSQKTENTGPAEGEPLDDEFGTSLTNVERDSMSPKKDHYSQEDRTHSRHSKAKTSAQATGFAPSTIHKSKSHKRESGKRADGSVDNKHSTTKHRQSSNGHEKKHSHKIKQAGERQRSQSHEHDNKMHEDTKSSIEKYHSVSDNHEKDSLEPGAHSQTKQENITHQRKSRSRRSEVKKCSDTAMGAAKIINDTGNEETEQNKNESKTEQVAQLMLIPKSHTSPLQRSSIISSGRSSISTSEQNERRPSLVPDAAGTPDTSQAESNIPRGSATMTGNFFHLRLGGQRTSTQNSTADGLSTSRPTSAMGDNMSKFTLAGLGLGNMPDMPTEAPRTHTRSITPTSTIKADSLPGQPKPRDRSASPFASLMKARDSIKQQYVDLISTKPQFPDIVEKYSGDEIENMHPLEVM